MMEKIAPYKSKAQRRWMHAAEDRGEVPEGTADRWEKHTPKGKKLPERVKKAFLHAIYDKDVEHAFAKFARRLKKLPPVPTAILEQREAMRAQAEKLKGKSPVAARVAKNPRLT